MDENERFYTETYIVVISFDTILVVNTIFLWLFLFVLYVLLLSGLRQRILILSNMSLSKLTPTNSHCPHFSLKSMLFKERKDHLLGKFKGIWGAGGVSVFDVAN